MSAQRFEPSGAMRGTLRPPPDKSISHRAALIAAMADGESEIRGYLDAADTRSTLAAVKSLGAKVEEKAGDDGLELGIRGVGLRGPRPAAIDVGNAGTLLRLLPGWLAGQENGEWVLDGDESIRRRPVDRVAEPLRQMGATISCREERLPPLEIRGSELTRIRYLLPVASAQVKSCVLLAGLLAEGVTEIVEPVPSRDHTERMLGLAGVELEIEEDALGRRIRIGPAKKLGPLALGVPGDVSSAAFPLVAAILVEGSEVKITDVGLNSTRSGLLRILERMGAALKTEVEGGEGEEPSGTIEARASKLEATAIGGNEVPLAIDELPLIALAGCFAEGTTVIRDAAELRHKETDRIATVCDALAAIGGKAEPTLDGMVINGSGGVRGGTIAADGDHRIAMLGAVAGLASREGVTVEGFEAAAVSYPDLERDLATLVG